MQYCDSAQTGLCVPFNRAPKLCVGQEVSFTLSSEGEAIDIQALRPQAVEEQVEQRMEGMKGTQLRKLQRSINRFQNANLQERLKMLSRAEEFLETLIQQAEPDGDAICGLVCRVVGWLHPPSLHGHTKGVSVGQANSGGDVHRRVRRLLVLALSHLDLTDHGTRQAIATALTYIESLMKASGQSSNQWEQLRVLVSEARRKEVSDSHPRGKDRGSLQNGAFLPNRRLQELPTVFMATDHVELKCFRCPEVVTSQWRWQHPKTKVVHVLCPAPGKMKCYRRLGPGCRWQCDELTIHDLYQSLDFCQHQCRRTRCKACGGSERCSHGRCWYQCAVCKKRPRVKRRKESRYISPCQEPVSLR